jgi:hypothetical protein
MICALIGLAPNKIQNKIQRSQYIIIKEAAQTSKFSVWIQIIHNRGVLMKLVSSNGRVTIQTPIQNDSNTNPNMDRLNRQHNFRHKMSFPESNLSDPYFKQLLLNIDQSNLLRKDRTFGASCCVQPNYFNANEDLKKKYGGKFDQIKRRTVSAYIKLLDRFSVPVGPALQGYL